VNAPQESVQPKAAPTAQPTNPIQTGVKPAAPATLPTSQPATPPVEVAASVAIDRTRSSGAATDFGTISGNVTLKGTPPAETPLPLDPNCGALYPNAKPTTQFYVIGEDGGLADVLVYISAGLKQKTYPQPKLNSNNYHVLDQTGCFYTPYVSAAQVGQIIQVKNSDRLLHNVHPTPVVEGNQESNKAQLPLGPALFFRWTNEELFLRFKCDVHPWMFAYVSLLSHPYFAVTDTNGNFTIPNVPPGAYEIELYHRKAGKITKDIVVNAGHTSVVNSSIEVPK